VDVAPDGFAHPVYRSGFALAIRVPHVGQALPPVHAAEESETPLPNRDGEGAVPISAETPSSETQPVEEPTAPDATETPIPSRDREEAVVAPTPEEPTESEAPAASTPEDPNKVEG
jgi:hypothetical protein